MLVYERLRDLIVRGNLAPGVRLVEQEIATRLGTSRTPVRSALQRLQQERYVSVPPGGNHVRMMVAPLTLEDAHELFETVGFVEAASARRAALLPLSQRVRIATDISAINLALQRATEVARPDQNAVFDLDTRFHRAYVEAGAGPRLVALHDTVKPQAGRYIRYYIRALGDRIDGSIDEHVEVIEGIRKGDGTRTQEAVIVNWRNAAQRVADVIARVGERGI